MIYCIYACNKWVQYSGSTHCDVSSSHISVVSQQGGHNAQMTPFRSLVQGCGRLRKFTSNWRWVKLQSYMCIGAMQSF